DLVPVDGDDERSSGCQRFVTATLDALVEYRPSLVVLASSETYIESDRWALEAPDSGDRFTSASAKAAVWQDGLTRTISKLQAYGIEVVIVHPIPKAYGWDPRQCAVARILLAPGTCGTSWQLADANKTRARQMSAESAAAAATNIRTLDVARLLCPDGTCSTRQGGTWTYRDGGHISVAAAAWLTPEFERLLAPSSR
ncbi:MAG TPA: SGNH hydrolase domain-containing protein, partial [Ilumatobacter sp.]